MDGNTLALYLIALALIEGNGETYVSRELRQALETLQRELKLK